MWRYAKALLVDVKDSVSLGEGWTPLVPGEWDEAPVQWKLELAMPTGSFKDRGMTVMVSYLKSRGVTRVLEDSSGNAGCMNLINSSQSTQIAIDSLFFQLYYLTQSLQAVEALRRLALPASVRRRVL